MGSGDNHCVITNQVSAVFTLIDFFHQFQYKRLAEVVVSPALQGIESARYDDQNPFTEYLAAHNTGKAEAGVREKLLQLPFDI